MCGWLEDVQDPGVVVGGKCPECPHGVMSHGTGEICAAGCDHCDCPLTPKQIEEMRG